MLFGPALLSPSIWHPVCCLLLDLLNLFSVLSMLNIYMLLILISLIDTLILTQVTFPPLYLQDLMQVNNKQNKQNS